MSSAKDLSKTANDGTTNNVTTAPQGAPDMHTANIVGTPNVTPTDNVTTSCDMQTDMTVGTMSTDDIDETNQQNAPGKTPTDDALAFETEQKDLHFSILLTSEDEMKLRADIVEKNSCTLCHHCNIKGKVKLTNHVESVHLKYTVLYNGKRSLLCKLPCFKGIPQTHYHCSHCNAVYRKRELIQSHLKAVDKQEEQSANQLVTKIARDKTEECKACHKILLARHMKKHMSFHQKEKPASINQKSHHHGVLIDSENGLYMVSKSIKGNQYPLHVRRKIADKHQSMECEDPFCRDGYKMAARSRDATKSCPHLQSTQFITDVDEKRHLHESVLSDLISRLRISVQRSEEMTRKNSEAKAAHQPAVSVFFPNGNDGRTSTFYMSVFTNVKESYCRLQRTVISVNTEQDRWTCACEKHKMKRGCIHKAMAKWFLMEYFPDKLQTDSTEDNDQIDLSTVEEQIEEQETSASVSRQAQIDMTEYIYRNKKIPLYIDSTILAQDNRNIERIIPTEEVCRCGRAFTNKSLRLVTACGILVCIKFVKRNIHVFHKSCESCVVMLGAIRTTDPIS